MNSDPVEGLCRDQGFEGAGAGRGVGGEGGESFECPPLDRGAGSSREWTFAERYPALAYLRRRGARELSAVEAEYERAVEFARRFVAPRALEIDRRMFFDPGYVPQEVLRAACSYGLFSAPFPRVLGGRGLHPLATAIALEVIATSCAGIANLVGVNGLAIAVVLSTMDLRAVRRVAELVCEGERAGEPKLRSTCVTEPGSGSDSEDRDELPRARLCTVARPVPGGFRLNGTKVFISNASLASLHVVVAVRDPADPARTLTVLLVPAGSPGVSIARLEKKMGQKVCPAGEVVFEEVFVPEEFSCRLDDPEGKGIANVLALTRSGVGAFAAGIAEGVYRIALEYARTHRLSGEPLQCQQWVQVALAEMARRAELARSIYVAGILASGHGGLYGLVEELRGPFDPPRALAPLGFGRWLSSDFALRRARRLLRRQRPELLVAACALGDVAKVSASDLAMENCWDALALIGKEGMRHDLGAEKCLRDARLLQIYEGTNEINRIDLAKRRVRRRFA